MSHYDYTAIVSSLNGCTAKFYTADASDLATLGAILATLDEVHDEYPISEEFSTRLGTFVNQIEESMLSDSVKSIIDSGPTIISELLTLIPEYHTMNWGATPDRSLPELNEGQLLFAQENISIEQEKLDTLEDLILAVEQDNDPAKWASIDSILHSLKGDFGVLRLSSLVNLVHRVEDELISCGSENRQGKIPLLLTFRDLVAGRVQEIISGVSTPISDDEMQILFESTVPPEELSGKAKKVLTPTLIVDAEVDLLKEFITESKEHIVSAESALMDLESDPTNRDMLDAAFRSCHTVKGVAGFLNLKPLQELAHSLESVMDAGRTGKITFTSSILTILLSGFDFLGEFIAQIESLLPSGEADINPLAFDVYTKLNELNESIMAGGEISTVQPSCSSTVTASESVALKPEVEKTEVTESVTNRVPEIATTPVKTVKNEHPEHIRKSESSDHATHAVDETVRVSVQRLDRLIDSIGEIVIAQSMLTADPDFVRMKSRSVEQKASQISIVMRQIQEEAMSLRMISLKSTFQKMSRLVRDLSQKMDKPVELIVTGEDTELDKSIIEHIGDPLVHMLRNSLDHGIESAQERLDAGKEPIGTVELRAYHKSGNVVIDIVDDGRGLNRDRLLQKAIENGIAVAHREYSEQEIYQFIFAPGFSTASEITDISGRGVGMDVVKRNILSMRGSLEIHSDEGKGTCFSIKLPLTMAIIDGMIVNSGGEILILPTLSIVSTLNPKPGQIQTIRGKGEVLNLHDQLYRFVRLSDLLGLECERKDPTAGIAIIIENILGNRIALWVDGILKKQQVVIKSLGRLFRNYKWISGGAVLGDGKINLILDVNELFQMVEK